jgi:hypothetical protein
MRREQLAIAAAAAFALLSTHAHAQTRGGVFEGFGGTTFGTTASAPTFGGSVGVPLGDHVQIVGEAGRLADVKDGRLDAVLDLTPADVRLAAWYGEGGIRFTGSRHAAVRPYVEATAGVARLTATVAADGLAGTIANAGLAFLSQTEPIVGVGAGLLLQGGPFVVDAGYRYKRIMHSGGFVSAFALDDRGLDVSQVRVGVGVRF